jgi:hypothetical protein
MWQHQCAQPGLQLVSERKADHLRANGLEDRILMLMYKSGKGKPAPV